MAIRPKAAQLIPCSTGLLLVLMLLHSAPAGAATFTVNSTADAPDATPGNGTCAAAGPPVCTLRAAVQEANALVADGTASANVINLPAGTYGLTIAGRDEDAAATGDLDVNGGALNVRGAGAGNTTIDGNQLDRLFHLGTLVTLSDPNTARPTTFSLEGVTVRNGNAVSFPTPILSTSGPDVGGGIRIERNSGLVVRRAIFRNNRAGQRGGAIAMPPSAATVAGADPAITTELTDVTLEGNSAGVEGGGAFNNRVAFYTRVIVKDNTVTGTDTTGPNAPRGGGIAQSGDLSLTDVIVSGNSMATGNGGGIANRGDPNALPAPGIFGTIRLNRVTVSDNSAAQAGGIGNGNGATASLINTTISGNRASSAAGGLANAGSATLTNVTLSGNTSPGGGGVVTLGPPAGAANAALTLRNTILAHAVGGGPNCLPPSTAVPFARLPTSGGDNISSDASCNLTGPGDSNTTDPRLGPLADNGGFTPTHALVPGSPAINGVRNNPCPPPAIDQRGVPRPQGPRCDIGAYERGVPPTVPPDPPSPVPPFAGCPAASRNVIQGTSASNSITGTTGADRIFAQAGDDFVDGLAGDDCIDLGPGTDLGRGGLGNDLVLGGVGGDRLEGGSGGDRLHGGPNGDRIDAGNGNDRGLGDQGNDLISGDLGNDVLRGGSGNDRVLGRGGHDRINGGSGRDRLSGGRGRDRINGGSGNDRIGAFDVERDRINCGPGRDRVVADLIDRVSRTCERVRFVRLRRTT